MPSIVVQYGNYTHQSGEVEYSISRSADVSDLGMPVRQIVTVDMNGVLYGESTTNIDQKVTALQNAYNKDSQSWRVLADGSPLAISKENGATIGGIHVTVKPQFPENRNAAYVTFLPYRIQLTWIEAVPETTFLLKSFTESLTFSGGGQRRGFIEVATGLPVLQKLRENTVYKVIQQGQAVGAWREPIIPLPLFPDALMEAPEIFYGNGVVKGPPENRYQIDIPASWKYVFESAEELRTPPPIPTRPNRWGSVSAIS